MTRTVSTGTVRLIESRIATVLASLMRNNNESVYLGQPIRVSYTRAEKRDVTDELLRFIVAKRFTVHGCRVVRIEPDTFQCWLYVHLVRADSPR